MEVKVKFNDINVKEEKEKTLVKILMLKGPKGDTVSAEWGTITGNVTDQTDLKNALDSKASQSEVTQALNQKANSSDLNNYYNKSQIDTALGSKLGTEDIVDRLDSTSSDKALSANQGKILKDEVDSKATLSDIEETFATIEQLNSEITSRTNADNTLQTNINNEANARTLADNNLQSQISGLASGSPLAASSISEMTDTSKVYVNTTDGHWYYYDGTNWTDGGVYQATEDSDTLIYLENKVNDTLKNGTFNYVNQVSWEGGAFNPTSGAKSSSPATAKRTVNFIDIPYSKLHITKSETGYAFYLVRYNKLTHDFIATETMKSSITDITYNLNENEVYKFCLNKNDQTTTDLNVLIIEPHNTIFDELLKINQIEDKAIITFIDDDESINFYNNNKTVFDNYNMKCDCAIVTDWVGENNRMSLEQLQELQSQGFEIICHSKTHDSKWQTPKTSSIESLKEDAQIAYNYMSNNNFNTDIFVYPFGSGSGWNTSGKHRVAKIINQVGFNYGVRAAGNNGINEKPLDNLLINRLFIDKNNDLSTYTNIIDTAIANKQWIIFGMHSGNTSQIDSTYLNTLLNYISTLNTNETVIEVMTFTQALQYKRNILSKGVLNFEDYTYIDKDGKFYY